MLDPADKFSWYGLDGEQCQSLVLECNNFTRAKTLQVLKKCMSSEKCGCINQDGDFQRPVLRAHRIRRNPTSSSCSNFRKLSFRPLHHNNQFAPSPAPLWPYQACLSRVWPFPLRHLSPPPPTADSHPHLPTCPPGPKSSLHAASSALRSLTPKSTQSDYYADMLRSSVPNSHLAPLTRFRAPKPQSLHGMVVHSKYRAKPRANTWAAKQKQ